MVTFIALTPKSSAFQFLSHLKIYFRNSVQKYRTVYYRFFSSHTRGCYTHISLSALLCIFLRLLNQTIFPIQECRLFSIYFPYLGIILYQLILSTLFTFVFRSSFFHWTIEYDCFFFILSNPEIEPTTVRQQIYFN